MKIIYLCMLFVLQTLLLIAQPPNFTYTPAVICVGAEVSFTYTGGPFNTFFWSFCSANPADPPHADILNTPPGSLSGPVFIALAKQGDDYFSFVVNHTSRRITRIKFGTDILNPNPTVENLPILLPPEPEGIQVVFDEAANQWYGFVIGGRFSTFPPIADNRFFWRLEFGNSLNNIPTHVPIVINPQMGLNFSHDLYVFKDEDTGNWFALTVNKGTHAGDIGTITRFNFVNGLNQPPSFDNLGNLNGTLVDPVGIFPIKDKHTDDWYLFVTDTDKGLIRVTFPEGLTGPAHAVIIGKMNGILDKPRDISLLRYCEEIYGFVVDGEGQATPHNRMVRLDFGQDLTSFPTATPLNNMQGVFNFPHSLSDIIRYDDEMFALVSNVGTDRITRVFFPTCIDEIPSQTGQSPEPVVYNNPGWHTVELIVDLGLPTQQNICKEIYINALPTATMQGNLEVCTGSPVQLRVDLTGVPPWLFTYTDGTTVSDLILTSTTPYYITVTPNQNTTYNAYFVTDQRCVGNPAGNGIVVTVLPRDNATFRYEHTTLCLNASPILPSFIATPGGTFSAPAGLIIDQASGEIIPSQSLPGQYTITYTTNHICPNSSTVTIFVASDPTAAFSYKHPLTLDSIFCRFGANAIPVFPPGSGPGIFSSNSPALRFADNQGTIDLSNTPAGFYTIFNQIPPIPGCEAVIDSTTIKIVELPHTIFISDTVCFGTPTKLSDMSTTSYGKIFARQWWIGEQQLPQTDSLIEYTFPSAGVHPVRLNAITTSGCIGTFEGEIFVKALPEVNILPPGIEPIAPDTIHVCVFDTIFLDAGNPGAMYHWEPWGSTERELMVFTSGIGYDVQTHWVTVTNPEGCVSVDSLTVIFSFAACTGIGNLPNGSRVTLFPNPATGVSNLRIERWTGTLHLQIADIVGNIITSSQIVSKGNKTTRIPETGSLPAGIYIVRLGCFRYTWTAKLVVK